MKQTFKITAGLLVWLISVEIERTYDLGFYSMGIILSLFAVSILFLVIGKIIPKGKGKKMHAVSVSCMKYFGVLLALVFIVNAIYARNAKASFDQLVFEINAFKNKNGRLPEQLSDLKSPPKNVYALLRHDFIYEDYKPEVYVDGNLIDDPGPEIYKMVGYKYPMGYSKYTISKDDKDLNAVIKSHQRRWYEPFSDFLKYCILATRK